MEKENNENKEELKKPMFYEVMTSDERSRKQLRDIFEKEGILYTPKPRQQTASEKMEAVKNGFEKTKSISMKVIDAGQKFGEGLVKTYDSIGKAIYGKDYNKLKKGKKTEDKGIVGALDDMAQNWSSYGLGEVKKDKKE